MEFNSDNYKNILESLSITAINASVKKIPKIEIAEFSDFLKLLEAYSIKVVLTEIFYYDESDFELLTIDDIEEKYRIKGIEKRIKEFNQRLQSLQYLDGKEQFIDLYFHYQGIVYNYSWGNDALDETNVDYFIESLSNQFSNEIEANVEKERNETIQRKNNYIKYLKEYIRNDKSFLTCTNQELRRSYVAKLLENEELRPPDEFSIYGIASIVNETWIEIKNSRKTT